MPALIFDCDGVLADTERFGHLAAFNQMFREFGLPVQWSDEDYAVKVLIGGGKERLASLLTPSFVADAGLPPDAAGQATAVASWHKRKTEIYTALVASGALPARPGIDRITRDAAARGITLAVASTSAEPSVRAVLEHAIGPERAAMFTVFAGDIVPAKKPAPDIYLYALNALGLSPDEAVVIEDSANGMRAALAAGLRTVVTTSSFTTDEDFTGASLVVPSLGDPGSPGSDRVVTLDDLLALLPSATPADTAPPAPADTALATPADATPPTADFLDSTAPTRTKGRHA